MGDFDALAGELLAALAVVTGQPVHQLPEIRVATEAELAVALEDTAGVPQHSIDHHERRLEALQLLGALERWPTGAELAPYVEGLFTPDPPLIRLHPEVAADEDRLGLVLAHELAHAWQWEHRPELVALQEMTSDAELARLSLVEGEAEWLGMRSLLVSRGLTLPTATDEVTRWLGSWPAPAETLALPSTLGDFVSMELFFPYVYGPLAAIDGRTEAWGTLEVLERAERPPPRPPRTRAPRPFMRRTLDDALGPWLSAAWLVATGGSAEAAQALIGDWRGDRLQLWQRGTLRCAVWTLDAGEASLPLAARLDAQVRGGRVVLQRCTE